MCLRRVLTAVPHFLMLISNRYIIRQETLASSAAQLKERRKDLLMSGIDMGAKEA